MNCAPSLTGDILVMRLNRITRVRVSTLIRIGKVTFEVHTIVEDAAELDLAVCADAIQEEVPWLLYLSHGFPDSVATMAEMVSPRCAGDLGTGSTACKLWGFGHIPDRPLQQGFVADSGFLPELLVRPFKNRLDILFGLR